MDRVEQLRQVVNLLRGAVAKARALAHGGQNGVSREAALATQIEGIAMEFEIIARTESDEQRGRSPAES